MDLTEWLLLSVPADVIFGLCRTEFPPSFVGGSSRNKGGNPCSSSMNINETINIQDLEVDPHSWTDLGAKLQENMKRSCFKRARFDVYSEHIAPPG